MRPQAVRDGRVLLCTSVCAVSVSVCECVVMLNSLDLPQSSDGGAHGGRGGSAEAVSTSRHHLPARTALPNAHHRPLHTVLTCHTTNTNTNNHTAATTTTTSHTQRTEEKEVSTAQTWTRSVEQRCELRECGGGVRVHGVVCGAWCCVVCGVCVCVVYRRRRTCTLRVV